jgi:hypothetical protein
MTALFQSLGRQVRAQAEGRQRKRIELLAQQVRTDVAGVTATVEQDRLVLSGRGLRRRWLSESALRFASELGR